MLLLMQRHDAPPVVVTAFRCVYIRGVYALLMLSSELVYDATYVDERYVMPR